MLFWPENLRLGHAYCARRDGGIPDRGGRRRALVERGAAAAAIGGIHLNKHELFRAVAETIRQHPEYTIDQIACAIGVSRDRVRYLITYHPELEYKSKRCRRDHTKEARLQVICAVIAAHPDATAAKIAELTGIPASSVHRLLRRGDVSTYMRERIGLDYHYTASAARCRKRKALVGNQKNIAEIAKRAQAQGMSYGEYVAKGGE